MMSLPELSVRVDQLVEAAPGMDVDLFRALVPKVEPAFRPVLAVEVGQRNAGRFGLVIIIEAESGCCLADAAFSALCEYDSFWHCVFLIGCAYLFERERIVRIVRF